MSLIEVVDIILGYILGPVIVSLGWLGNITGIIVLSKKNLDHLGPIIMFKTLLITDTIYLINVLVVYLDSIGFKIITLSDVSCKLYAHMGLSIGCFSPLILAYISFYRFILIKYPSKSLILKKNKTQFIYITSVFISCFVYYSPIDIYAGIQEYNNSTMCLSFNSEKSKIIMFILDSAFRTVFIFVLMLIFSLLLIYCIISSRRRVFSNYTSSENRLFKKDLRLSISSIFLNLLYISLTVPVTLTTFVFTQSSHRITMLSYYVYYSNYSLTAYTLFASNFLFRRKLISLFRNCSKSVSSNNNQEIETH